MLNTPWETVNTIVNTGISGGLVILFFWCVGGLIWSAFTSPWQKHRADTMENEVARLRAENAKVSDLEWRIRDAQWQIDYSEENLAFYRSWIAANLPQEIQAEMTKDWCEWSNERSRRKSRETTFGPYLITDQRDDEGGAPAQAVPA